MKFCRMLGSLVFNGLAILTPIVAACLITGGSDVDTAEWWIAYWFAFTLTIVVGIYFHDRKKGYR